MTFHEICNRVIAAAKHAPQNSGLQYAAAYAKAGLGMTDPEMIRVQKLYIDSNLSSWRGPEAREVKYQLRKRSK
ncbi:MAG: hypothetical protein ACRCYS_20105 [Beijerinckiaceae bacterium]